MAASIAAVETAAGRGTSNETGKRYEKRYEKRLTRVTHWIWKET